MSRDAGATAPAVLWQCVAKARRMGTPDERGDGDAKSWDRYLKQQQKPFTLCSILTGTLVTYSSYQKSEFAIV
jgi:hypothetical protein